MTDVFVYKFCKRHIPKLNKELFHAAVNVNHVQFIFLLLTASMHIRNVYIDIKNPQGLIIVYTLEECRIL